MVILAVIAAAIVIVVKKKSGNSDHVAPVPGPPGAVVQKYGDALKIAMQFFDVQKCRLSFAFPNFRLSLFFVIFEVQ